VEKYQVIKEELDLGCGEVQSDKSVMARRAWRGKQGGEGRGDEEWKSDERLRLRQGEREAATRRASAGRWPAGG